MTVATKLHGEQQIHLKLANSGIEGFPYSEGLGSRTRGVKALERRTIPSPVDLGALSLQGKKVIKAESAKAHKKSEVVMLGRKNNQAMLRPGVEPGAYLYSEH